MDHVFNSCPYYRACNCIVTCKHSAKTSSRSAHVYADTVYILNTMLSKIVHANVLNDRFTCTFIDFLGSTDLCKSSLQLGEEIKLKLKGE